MNVLYRPIISGVFNVFQNYVYGRWRYFNVKGIFPSNSGSSVAEFYGLKWFFRSRRFFKHNSVKRALSNRFFWYNQFRYSPTTGLNQIRFFITSKLYLELFNYKWYSNNLKHLLMKSTNHSILNFSSLLRRELLDSSFYKVTPK